MNSEKEEDKPYANLKHLELEMGYYDCYYSRDIRLSVSAERKSKLQGTSIDLGIEVADFMREASSWSYQSKYGSAEQKAITMIKSAFVIGNKRVLPFVCFLLTTCLEPKTSRNGCRLCCP